MFTVVVFGSRHYRDVSHFEQECDRLLAAKHPHIEIVEGDCQGPDKMAEAYAHKRGYKHQKFPADWAGQGKRAGFLRNRQMADYVAKQPEKGAISFWDQRSAGTSMMIDLVRDRGIPLKIVTIPEPPPKPLKMAKSTPIITHPDQITTGKPRARKKAIVIEGEELIPDIKPKAKKAPRIQFESQFDYKKFYQDAYEEWFKVQYPSVYRDGHFIPHKMPDVCTANGLTSYIIDHMTWTGNYANRINVMGRQVGGITKTQSGATFDDRKFIKSSTRKGSEDIDGILFRQPVKFEIKIGSDRQSDKQKEHESKVKKAGGDYRVIKIVDDYISYFLGRKAMNNGLFGSIS